MERAARAESADPAHMAEALVEIGRVVQWLQDFRDFLEKGTTRELFASPDDLGAKGTAIG